jgi:hypothetical protein
VSLPTSGGQTGRTARARRIARRGYARLRDAAGDVLCAWHRLHNHRYAAAYDFRRTMVISGVRRGGTTWLAELLHESGQTTLLWEPLTLNARRQWSDLRVLYNDPDAPNPNLWWSPYIPQDANWPEAREYFRRLLSGQILHSRLLQYNGSFALRPTERYLVKFCHANRLLPWLVTNFSTRPPVFLIRHPCAVVASNLRQLRKVRISPPYTIPTDRYSEEFHRPHRAYLATLETHEELHAALWCLDQLVPLRHPWNNQRWITLSYERLVKDGLDEFRAMCRRMEIDMPPNVEAKLTRPSRTTVDGSPILEGGDQLSGWRKHLSREQIDRILAVVEHFGLHDIYSEELEPNHDRLLAAGSGPLTLIATDSRAAQQAA